VPKVVIIFLRQNKKKKKKKKRKVGKHQMYTRRSPNSQLVGRKVRVEDDSGRFGLGNAGECCAIKESLTENMGHDNIPTTVSRRVVDGIPPLDGGVGGGGCVGGVGVST